MWCPRPEGGPGTSGMGPRPLLPPLPPFTAPSAGSSSSPAEGPRLGLSRPLGNTRAALAYLGSAGYSSPSGEWWVWQQLEGCEADVGLHFPPAHLFSSSGKKPPLLLVPPPPAPTPYHPPPAFACGLEQDGVTRGALGRGAAGVGGAARGGGDSPQPGLAAPAVGSVVGRRPGLAGRWAGGILAPDDWPRLGRRSCLALARCVCVWMRGPRGLAEKLLPRPQAPSRQPHWQPKFAGRKCNGFLFCIDF